MPCCSVTSGLIQVPEEISLSASMPTNIALWKLIGGIQEWHIRPKALQLCAQVLKQKKLDECLIYTIFEPIKLVAALLPSLLALGHAPQAATLKSVNLLALALPLQETPV
jgi:hypothetical protein